MKFETLEDAEKAFEYLDRERETMLTILKGYHIALASLVATHPNYEQFQLHLTSTFEGPGMRVLGKDLDEKQAHALREVVESLQQIRGVTGRIDPLATLSKKP